MNLAHYNGPSRAYRGGTTLRLRVLHSAAAHSPTPLGPTTSYRTFSLGVLCLEETHDGYTIGEAEKIRYVVTTGISGRSGSPSPTLSVREEGNVLELYL